MQFSRRAFTLSAASAPLVPMLAGAQNATPAATGFENATVRINELLQFAPGGMLDDQLNVVWNDYERQVAAVRTHNEGSTEAESDDDLAMMSLYASGPEFLNNAFLLEEVAGFTFGQVLQSLELGLPPATTLLIKLNDNPEALIPFWESVGYEERENDYGTFWTIGEDGDLDLTHPVQRVLLARFNNVAILPGNVLAYSPNAELLGQIMSVPGGDTPNRIAEFESILAGLPEDATSAWLAEGTNFAMGNLFAGQALSAKAVNQIEDIIAESNDAVGAMPVIRTFCVGTTAGGYRDEELHNPQAREFILLETDEADMAEQAAEVILWRNENLQSLNTGQPLREILPGLEAEALDGEFLRASRPLSTPRSVFTQLIFSRDTLLFAY